MNNEPDSDRTPLFEEFPPVTREEWEKKIKEDLKGADYRDKLKWETGEGFDLLPFYRRDDLEEVTIRGTLPLPDKERNDWEICQPVYDAEIEEASDTARRALQKGADALLFRLRIRNADGMLGGDIEGTALRDQDSFSRLLENADPAKHSIHFDSGMASPAILAMLANEVSSGNGEGDNVFATLLYDPYSFILTSGQMPKEENAFLDDARQMVEFCRSNLPRVRCLGIDGRLYNNAGGTIPQELGFSLATASEYLARLGGLGCDPEDVAGSMHFALSAGSSYFLEIAKFRALRFLWSNIVEQYLDGNGEAPEPYIRGESSRWNKTVYDPYTNMLRTTTEGMSAALAGCDSVTTLPFNEPFTRPGDFARRIARNTQVILKEESHLDKVRDPGAGSYYIEKLTDNIAEKAWKQFQEVEKQGGMLKAVRGKYVQWAIEESQEKRNASIAHRNRIFVGTNQYPSAEETREGDAQNGYTTVSLPGSDNGEVAVDPERLIASMSEALAKGARLGDLVDYLYDLGKHEIPTIHPYRGPQIFESLREATENHGTPPSVFLLPMGDPKRRKARSTFAANLFGCIGYRIDDPIGFDTIEEAAESIRQSDADIVVLCSSDEEYEELVEPLCRHITEEKPEAVIVLAGDPGEREDSYREAGVKHFIHTKINTLETLKNFQRELGIMD